MNIVDGSIDLNLLVVLDALLTTHSTTLAARALGKTQSTVSHALDRLREALGDPLLVRVGRGLAPTPRALAIAGPLREWLRSADGVLRGDVEVDPSKLETTFTIAATDFVEATVLPPLVRRIRAKAPGVSLAVTLRGDAVERAVRDGDVDLFIGPFVREIDGLVAQTLYRDKLAVVMRKNHPLSRGELTLDRYVSAEHALATPRGLPGGLVDDRLAAKRRQRTVVVRTPSFGTAARLASTTDLLATLPATFARFSAESLPLVVRELPLDLAPFAVAQAFRVTRRRDAALAWMRAQIADVTSHMA